MQLQGKRDKRDLLPGKLTQLAAGRRPVQYFHTLFPRCSQSYLQLEQKTSTLMTATRDDWSSCIAIPITSPCSPTIDDNSLMIWFRSSMSDSICLIRDSRSYNMSLSNSSSRSAFFCAWIRSCVASRREFRSSEDGSSSALVTSGRSFLRPEAISYNNKRKQFVKVDIP